MSLRRPSPTLRPAKRDHVSRMQEVRRDHVSRMQEVRRFFKANPQALVLLIICVVLGLGTFLAVVFGVATSKTPTKPSGVPVGAVGPRVTLVRPV